MRRPIVIVCEHASNKVPPVLNGLGVSADVLQSHVAWDIGAAVLARDVSRRLDAQCILAPYSRLVYDCNRDSGADDAVPVRSGGFAIPGNEGLSSTDVSGRQQAYSEPFHECVSAALDEAGPSAALVTVHSFTPLLNGLRRRLDVGVIHDEDETLAQALMACAEEMAGSDVRLNEPYCADDGVTHTLRKHGVARELPNVMIEVRNDHLSSAVDVRVWGERLSRWINAALSDKRALDLALTGAD